MGLFVEQTLLPGTEGALTGDKVRLLFHLLRRILGGSADLGGGGGRAGCFFDVYGSECYFTLPALFLSLCPDSVSSGICDKSTFPC